MAMAPGDGLDHSSSTLAVWASVNNQVIRSTRVRSERGGATVALIWMSRVESGEHGRMICGPRGRGLGWPEGAAGRR